MSTTFKRHMAQLDTGFYGSGFIRGLKLAQNRRGRAQAGYSVGRSYGGMSSGEIETLLTRIELERPRISETQAAIGIAYLRKLWRTPKGTERKTSPFGLRETRILEAFSHFSLVDWFDAGNDLPSMYPVYRVHSTDGGFFDYRAGSWQSGVRLEVIG